MEVRKARSRIKTQAFSRAVFGLLRELSSGTCERPVRRAEKPMVFEDNLLQTQEPSILICSKANQVLFTKLLC